MRRGRLRTPTRPPGENGRNARNGNARRRAHVRNVLLLCLAIHCCWLLRPKRTPQYTATENQATQCSCSPSNITTYLARAPCSLARPSASPPPHPPVVSLHWSAENCLCVRANPALSAPPLAAPNHASHAPTPLALASQLLFACACIHAASAVALSLTAQTPCAPPAHASSHTLAAAERRSTPRARMP